MGSESVSGPVANCVVAGSISTVGGSSVASSVGLFLVQLPIVL